jgi:hypothetical protein
VEAKKFMQLRIKALGLDAQSCTIADTLALITKPSFSNGKSDEFKAMTPFFIGIYSWLGPWCYSSFILKFSVLFAGG